MLYDAPLFFIQQLRRFTVGFSMSPEVPDVTSSATDLRSALNDASAQNL